MPNSIDANQIYFSLFNNCKEAVTITDSKNNIVKINPAFTKITGYTSEEALGQNPKILASGKHGKEFYAGVWDSLLKNDFWQGEIWNKRKNGEIYREWLTLRTVKDNTGKLIYHFAVFEDLSEGGNAIKHIDYLLNYDSLTELPNRTKFIKMVNTEIEKGRPMAFLSIDITRFKSVNDSYGYSAGDVILREVALRLKSACIKHPCIIGRYGNDEFIISLSNAKDEQIAELITIILEAVQVPINIAMKSYTPILAIGASKFPRNGSDAVMLLQQASTAMSYAKKNSKGLMQFYDAYMIPVLSSRLELEANLYNAVKMNEFEIYLQPKMQMDGKTLAGAEALVRWNFNGEIISPMKFIPLAEEIGLINQIGEFVMCAACEFHSKMLLKYPKMFNNFKIAINVSSAQLKNKMGFNGLICNEKNKCDRDTISKICAVDIELTESVAMSDHISSFNMLKSLQELGVAISIDDFGTGYSSLSYLRKLPIDALKIDQSFVKNIGLDGDDSTIIQTIIAMAKNLNLKVIAEGVETEEQRLFLQNAGCNLFQGFLVSKPIPLAEFEEKFLSIYK